MDTVVPLPVTPARPRVESRSVARRQIAVWLLTVCGLVFLMVVVGGVTRLTRSGLSITEWAPITGTLPPLTDADWALQFARYRQSPEYLKVNAGMSLAEFKGIFWWEYLHRLLGRVIGLAFFVPFAWFAIRGRIERSLVPRLAAIFVLGGVQGAIGWWMVASGLVDTPRVSHVRLAVHLGTAFLIFGAMWWTALGLLSPSAPPALAPERLRAARRAAALSVFVFVMVLSGALVAGTRAGLVYNTFPLMDGHVVPPGLFALDPWWDSVLHDLTTVQFDHRLFAWALMVVIPAFWWSLRRIALPTGVRLPANLLLAMLAVQVLLGVSTLVLHVPVALGAAHQGGALVLFALSLWTTHALRRG